MAIAFRSASTSTTMSGGTVSVPAPAGVALDDVLIATITAIDAGVPDSVPAGWTLLDSDVVVGAPKNNEYVYWKISTGAEIGNYAWHFSAGTTGNATIAVVLAYSGVTLLGTPVRGQANSLTLDAPSLSNNAGDMLITVHGGNRLGNEFGSQSAPTGMTQRTATGRNVDGTWSVYKQVSDLLLAANGSSGVRTPASTDATYAPISRTVILKFNTAPNAPTPVTPIAGTIDLGLTQRLDWDFSDDDPGDTQSKYDLRYRIVGDPTWTDLTGTTSNTYRDIAAGTFVAGDYEWQVRTYDSQGIVGPYSASAFFTAAVPPAGPSITDPINGQTIAAAEYTVVWSVPDQDDYQLRRVADAAGVADTATVYFDTGTVASTSARGLVVEFETNGRWEHVQLRVRDGGLWSSWASVRVQVDFTEPMVPVVTVTGYNDDGRILVNIENPASTGGEPEVVRNDVYRSSVEGVIRVATNVAPDGAFSDWAVASGVDHSYFVRAWGDNGTFVDSDLTGGITEDFSDEYGGY